ncbi:Calcyphosin-like protein,Calcyphosin,Crustacean calcium-binding protein 23 [Lepeophtheirus salmonis]|uniref:Calcyphosin-like protein,Calcyphosin,Crustacean calcium-binding protein 23 n=1 Tax=Lepeophtheirus salmonis TaxID=72036 RepID=A0A7R8D0V5_LEPSM|nr:Calcyphosin-like protein,Calcyphosin,Crustacean calcium-binding protein 23 [Lepeophtheirus salmonis]CAF2987937.1 Calcyphosin-like protein,Calcyphosin,Crustacean calcium-binding protein 23 [Lepeophtheirus salmonis]
MAKKKSTLAKDPLEKLRYFCLSQGVSGILGIGRLFRRIDYDGSKQLDMMEFQRDGSGRIDLNEFLVGIRPPMSECRLRVIDEAYNKLDKNKDGVINLDDVKGVYDVTKHPKFINGELTEDQILNKFLNIFESSSKNIDGNVTKSEFLEYYAGISASIDNDAYFDLMMRNAWKL